MFLCYLHVVLIVIVLSNACILTILGCILTILGCILTILGMNSVPRFGFLISESQIAVLL